jgi:hypothetical protein
MRKAVKWGGIGLAAGLIVIQLFRPEKNMSSPDPAEDLLMLSAAPEPVAELIRYACYDCHSNQTDYPWYSQIAPVSWYLHMHIKKGKEDLNASTYGSLEKADKIEMLVDLCEVVEAGSMPLGSYELMHRSARLSEEDKASICAWSEEEALKVMRE